MKNLHFLKILICLIFFDSLAYADKNYFFEGEKLYTEKKFKDAKFKFEQDILFNPKNEKSYMYLAKIFNNLEKSELEENNLNTVILLNPKNDEAIYYLALINIKKSNFKKAKELISTLQNVCNTYCNQKEKLEEQLKNSLKQ
jgi:hypothetical protein